MTASSCCRNAFQVGYRRDRSLVASDVYDRRALRPASPIRHLSQLMEGTSPTMPHSARASLARNLLRPELLHSLFSVRTLGLFERVPRSGLASYMSGLLIGAEMQDALMWLRARGKAQTCRRHRLAWHARILSPGGFALRLGIEHAGQRTGRNASIAVNCRVGWTRDAEACRNSYRMSLLRRFFDALPIIAFCAA